MTIQRRYERAADIRADGEGRRVVGVAVRYNDPTLIAGEYEEQVLPGAFHGRIDPRANVNYQHERSQPLALPEWDEADDALRVSFVLPPGARQDQALADARAGLIRGLSIEFVPDRVSVERQPDGRDRVSISTASLLGVAMVDAPAYKSSVYKVRYAGAEIVRASRTYGAARFLCIG